MAEEQGKSPRRDHQDSAVSPVVGVMLMLVVVIIIAAVVSGFAGSLIKGTQSAPQIAMDVNIANNGGYSTSYFKAAVTSVNAPISTNDLKIVTSWSKSVGNNTYKGGAVITPGITNFNVTYTPENGATNTQWNSVCPLGDGPGVGLDGTETSYGMPYEDANYPSGGASATGMSAIGQVGSGITNHTWFGNYNIQAGTVMFAQPFGGNYGDSPFTVGYGLGGTPFVYLYGTDTSTNGGGATFTQDSTDQMQAVLGTNWNILRPGDIVNIKLIHVPSGKTIWQGDIPVEGSIL
ncbi:MAG: type IV pilin [Methanoregula sp.]